MSVQTQIDRIKSNIANAYAKAREKGAELPAVQNSENLPAAIEAIPSGGTPEGLRTITVAADPPEGGEVSGGGVVSDGVEIAVRATANVGYKFSGWKESGEIVSPLNLYLFPVASNKTIIGMFSKNVLPDGYVELEYIQSNGSCYFYTDVVMQPNLRTIIDFEPLASPGTADAFIVHTYNSSNGAAYTTEWLSVNTLNGVSGRIGKNQNFATINGDNTPRRMIIDMDAENKTITADGQSVSFENNDISGGYYLSIFGSYGNKSTLRAKLYSCKMYYGSEKIRVYIPCKNPSGTIGLYDSVNKAFLTKTGSGTLTAGPSV